MREEKKALEQNISDLFALKAKHGMASRANVSDDYTPAHTFGRRGFLQTDDVPDQKGSTHSTSSSSTCAGACPPVTS